MIVVESQQLKSTFGIHKFKLGKLSCASRHLAKSSGGLSIVSPIPSEDWWHGISLTGVHAVLTFIQLGRK